MSERTFDRIDQERFAAWSGDRNPLHLQPEWAAQVYPGELVVHGMHVVLWLLDACLPSDRHLGRLSVTFVRPILLGDRVAGEISFTDHGAVIMAMVRGKVTARIDLNWADAHAWIEVPESTSTSVEPRIHDLAALAAASGDVPVPDAAPLAAAFPRLAATIGETAVCGLASLSTLVGMECPGLWSVFAEFTVDFTPTGGALRYEVSDLNRRFSRVSMNVVGCGLRGHVVAMTVPAGDVPAEDLEGIRELVTPGEFAGRSPLLVGAGTGLGAVSAVMLAAGGARPVITVHRSLPAGERLCEFIAATGGVCDLVRLDVNDPQEGLGSLADLGWHGDSLLYFASPRIFRRRIETFQQSDFTDFINVYVSAFYETVRALVAQRGQEPLRVFYPSSVAVETKPPEMLEYALAKQVGEGICEVLGREFPNVSTVIERLPRTQTRQTRTFVQTEAANPAHVMLPILRRLLG